MVSLLLDGGLGMSEKRIVLFVTSAGFPSGTVKKLSVFVPKNSSYFLNFFLLNNNNIGPVKGLKSTQKKSGLRKRKKKWRQKGGKTIQTCSKTVSNQILAHAQEELMLRRLTLD